MDQSFFQEVKQRWLIWVILYVFYLLVGYTKLLFPAYFNSDYVEVFLFIVLFGFGGLSLRMNIAWITFYAFTAFLLGIFNVISPGKYFLAYYVVFYLAHFKAKQ